MHTISSGSFGLPEDGDNTAPKHVAATLIFYIYMGYFEYAFGWFYFVVVLKCMVQAAKLQRGSLSNNLQPPPVTNLLGQESPSAPHTQTLVTSF
jgi:hypothetical protein